MTSRSSRDGRRQSRVIRGNAEGFEICTVDHMKGGKIRLDATITYSDQCEVDPAMADSMGRDGDESASCSTMAFAHKHADYDHDEWFRAYVPQEDDGCYVVGQDGTIKLDGDSDGERV